MICSKIVASFFPRKLLVDNLNIALSYSSIKQQYVAYQDEYLFSLEFLGLAWYILIMNQSILPKNNEGEGSEDEPNVLQAVEETIRVTILDWEGEKKQDNPFCLPRAGRSVCVVLPQERKEKRHDFVLLLSE